MSVRRDVYESELNWIRRYRKCRKCGKKVVTNECIAYQFPDTSDASEIDTQVPSVTSGDLPNQRYLTFEQ